MAQTAPPGWIDSFLGCLRSCFGLYKSVCAPIIEDEEHCNGSKIEDQAAQKPFLYDSFLSSSTYDIDQNYYSINNSSLQSSLERSISSANQNAEGSSIDSNEFRNHGLILWNETRLQWIGRKRQRRKSQEINNPRISWNATYETLLGSNRRFNQPIPLSEMVDFLVDVWEQEGLYDNTGFGII